MSRDAALAFLRKVAEDPGLQQELVAFAEERGYEFTVEELGDAELDSVTGGAAYVKIKYDVSGESKDSSHDKWIDVLSTKSTTSR